MCVKVIASHRWNVFETRCLTHAYRATARAVYCLGKASKPTHENNIFLLSLFGKKNYGIYLKRLIAVYLSHGYLPDIY